MVGKPVLGCETSIQMKHPGKQLWRNDKSLADKGVITMIRFQWKFSNFVIARGAPTFEKCLTKSRVVTRNAHFLNAFMSLCTTWSFVHYTSSTFSYTPLRAH